jgi:predicted RNA-binding Zn-ribbon protein involved in translation (DUF1610 family)
MNDMLTKSNESGTKDIGNKKKWIRNCPKCGRDIIYVYQSNYCHGVSNNSKCIFCAHDGQLKGRVQTDEEKEKRAKKLRGKKRTNISRKRYAASKTGNKNPKFGDHSPKSEEHRRKIRLSCIEVVRQRLALSGKPMKPSFNPNACIAIDDYGKKNGYNFRHALNGGEHYIKELGYWVDGYDAKRNVVVEYFENNHWHRKNKKKDIDRCREIMYYLKCDFIILREEIGGSYLSEYFCQ